MFGKILPLFAILLFLGGI